MFILSDRQAKCAERWTHPEADERQISPDVCVLLDQMTGLDQGFLSCDQLLQLRTHTPNNVNIFRLFTEKKDAFYPVTRRS